MANRNRSNPRSRNRNFSRSTDSILNDFLWADGTDPRPYWLVLGDYMETKPMPTNVRCKAYTHPPGCEGEYITTIEPGTILGPIEALMHSDKYCSIRVGDQWINVWCTRDGRGVSFARKVQAIAPVSASRIEVSLGTGGGEDGDGSIEDSQGAR